MMDEEFSVIDGLCRTADELECLRAEVAGWREAAETMAVLLREAGTPGHADHATVGRSVAKELDGMRRRFEKRAGRFAASR